MKVERGTFIGPRAPFGYQKAEANHDQLVPDPIASITVRKIFELAANGTGVTGIVRYLNEKGLPTPIQYARSNGLTGSFADGTGDWNSRSVKYILTNRTYTGMLVQGKEKRVVKGTHEPLVDVETFDRIQSEFKARSFNVSPTPEASENVFKGKVSTSTCSLKWTRNKVVYVSREYTPDCMHRRNRHLVDHSGTCICYLTRSTGGTAYTVDYARKRGLRIIWIIHRRSIIQNVHVVLPVNESVVCYSVNSCFDFHMAPLRSSRR